MFGRRIRALWPPRRSRGTAPRYASAYASLLLPKHRADLWGESWDGSSDRKTADLDPRTVQMRQLSCLTRIRLIWIRLIRNRQQRRPWLMGTDVRSVRLPRMTLASFLRAIAVAGDKVPIWVGLSKPRETDTKRKLQ